MYINELINLMTVEEIIMYLRKSRADRPEESVEEVLAKHERDIQESIIRIFGKKIPEENIYREVVSGETITDRPEMMKVLSKIENNNVKAVMVYDVQRLSRGDWEDGGKILTAFKYSNTLIITPTKIFDLNEPSGYDYKTFKMELSAGNEFLEYTKTILRKGILRSVKQGNYVGSVAPYGYRKVTIDGSHTLEIDETEAPAVKMIFELYASGIGMYRLKMKMDKTSYKPRTGRYWSDSTIRQILQNPIYIGKVRWNYRMEKKVYEDGVIKKVNVYGTEDEIQIIDGKHPAIIDNDLFNTVQEIFGSHTKEKANTELRNPLATLMQCQCGCSMVLRTYKDKSGKETRKKRICCRYQVNCHTKSANFDDVFERVIKTLEMYVEDFKIKLKQQDNNMIDMHEQTIKNLEKELEKLNAKQDEIYDFLEDGIYTKEVFLKRNAKLQDNIDETKAKLKDAKENAPKKIDYEEKIIKFNDVINVLKDENVKPKIKNEMIKEIVDKIVYNREDNGGKKSITNDFTLDIILKD